MSRSLAVRAYRLAAALLVLAAIAYRLQLGLSGARFSTTDFFSYFTELSNLYAAGLFLALGLRGERPRSAALESARGAAVLYMLTTGIVFLVLLSKGAVTSEWVNTVLHRVMPVAVALDWLIDPPRVRLTARAAIVWMAFPTLYIAYTLIRGPLVHWYPYFFVDPGRAHGYGWVAIAVIAIGLGMLAMGALVAWVGNRRGAPATAPAPPRVRIGSGAMGARHESPRSRAELP